MQSYVRVDALLSSAEGVAVYFCIVASFHLACIAITVIEILSILPEWL